jgi:hypothetical protein
VPSFMAAISLAFRASRAAFRRENAPPSVLIPERATGMRCVRGCPKSTGSSDGYRAPS